MGVRQCPGWEVQSHQEICGPRGRDAQGKKESPKVGVGWQLNNGNCMMCKFPPTRADWTWGHMQGALQGSGNAPSGRVAGRINIGVGPRSACGIIIIDIESWERWWWWWWGGGGGGGEPVPDGQP